MSDTLVRDRDGPGLLQVPRLYNVYKAQGLLENFEQMLDNLFRPLFEVTADPTTHPQLHVFLQQVRHCAVSTSLHHSSSDASSAVHTAQSSYAVLPCVGHMRMAACPSILLFR